MRFAQAFALLVAILISGCQKSNSRSATPPKEELSQKKAPTAQRATPEVRALPPEKVAVAPVMKKQEAPVVETPKQIEQPPEVITKEVDGKKYTATIRAKGQAIGNPKQPPAVNVRADVTDKDGKMWNVHYQRTGTAMKMNIAQGTSTMLVTCDGDTWTLSRGKCNITETLRATKVTMSAMPVENPAQIKTAQEMLSGAKHLLYIVYELLDPQEKGSVEGEFAGFRDLLPSQSAAEEPTAPAAEVVPLQEKTSPASEKMNAAPVIQEEAPKEATLAPTNVEPQKEPATPAPAAAQEETTPSTRKSETATMPEPVKEATPLLQEKPKAQEAKPEPAETMMDGRDEVKNAAPETANESESSPVTRGILLGLGVLVALCALGYLGYVFLKKNPPGAPRPGSPMDRHVQHIESKLGTAQPERRQIAAITHPQEPPAEDTDEPPAQG